MHLLTTSYNIKDNKSKKVGFLIPDGIGIRNYLFSPIIPHILEQNNKVIVLHNLPKHVIQKKAEDKLPNLNFLTAEVAPELIGERFIREATTYGRLKINSIRKSNPTILRNWKKHNLTWKQKLLYLAAAVVGSFFKTYKKIHEWEKKREQIIRKGKLYKIAKKQLNELKLDSLLCTHQRVPFATAYMLAAKDLGITTYTAIYSWDNLPKARLVMSSDYYLVWSTYMKRELRDYYPHIEEKSIIITGTPQFDFYQDSKLILDRKSFANEYNLNPHKKWVLYSGDDPKTSPYDADYLNDIATALAKETDIQVLFRQAPVEDIKRYQNTLDVHPIIKHIPPKWEKGKTWSLFTPTKEDIQLLVNLSMHCHVVVNVGSTMALDFAHFDRPGVYINYDQPHAQNWSVDIIYQFEHFKTMNGLDAVGWINSKDEILNVIRKAIDAPDSIAPDRMQWKKRIAGTHKVLASEQIAKKLQENF